MWIYSFISSHLSNILLPPPGEPTPYPPPPSEATPAPYRFPVLDPSSTEHNPLSFHEQRPVGTFVKKKTKEMEKQEMEEFNRRLKEKRNPKRPGEEQINIPIPAPFKKEAELQPDATETPPRVVTGYLTAEVEMLCSESDWQFQNCVLQPSYFMPPMCIDERKRKSNCRRFHRAYLISMGYGLPERTRQQDTLASRLSDLAWQAKVRDGTALMKESTEPPEGM